jgi:hypothetical protein
MSLLDTFPTLWMLNTPPFSRMRQTKKAKKANTTRKKPTSNCFAGLTIYKKAIVSGISVPHPHYKGKYTMALFRDGVDYVTDKAFSDAEVKKIRDKAYQDPNTFLWNDKTPAELEKIAKKVGYKPPHNANLLKKLTNEIGFLKSQMERAGC